jgi:hypothetical protein
MQIVFGIILLAIGVFLTIKTDWFLENFGRMAWFEDKLGTEGGSRLGYKFIGIILIAIGIIMMTGSGNAFFGWVVSPLTQYSNNQN